MNITSEKASNKKNWGKWIARILSSLTTILWGWWLIGNLIPQYLEKGSEYDPTFGELAVSVFFVIVLVGTIIGWWNEKWGGLLLIAGYIANAIGGYFLAVSSHGSAGYIIGFIPVLIFLPLLISGYLYLLFWKQNSIQKKKL